MSSVQVCVHNLPVNLYNLIVCVHSTGAGGHALYIINHHACMHAQALERWHRNKAEAWTTYERDVASAKAMHEANLKCMRDEWEEHAREVRTVLLLYYHT